MAEKARWGEHDLSAPRDQEGEDLNWFFLAGGGGGVDGDENEAFQFPDSYEAELYLNGEPQGSLTLLPVEGGEWIEP